MDGPITGDMMREMRIALHLQASPHTMPSELFVTHEPRVQQTMAAITERLQDNPPAQHDLDN